MCAIIYLFDTRYRYCNSDDRLRLPLHLYIMASSDKVAIFIDSGYFNKALEEFAEEVNGRRKLPRIDFGKIGSVLAEIVNADLFRVYFYDCRPFQSSPPTPEESTKFALNDRFLKALTRIPRFVVREGRLNRYTVVCKKCNRAGCRLSSGIIFTACWAVRPGSCLPIMGCMLRV